MIGTTGGHGRREDLEPLLRRALTDAVQRKAMDTFDNDFSWMAAEHLSDPRTPSEIRHAGMRDVLITAILTAARERCTCGTDGDHLCPVCEAREVAR